MKINEEFQKILIDMRSMQNAIQSQGGGIDKFSVLEDTIKINASLRDLLTKTHSMQFFLQWQCGDNPGWFDHYLDLCYQWGKSSGNAFWLERGIFSLLAIEPGAKILELCCGDGFNAKYFYSYKANSICSCDFDSSAIAHARTYNMTNKTQFVLADIRKNMPDGKFDNIIWDAAIQYFTPTEIEKIMLDIKNRLVSNGILSGYTIVERPEGKSLKQHEYEFKDKQDLLRFLTPHFKHAKVFETIYSDRHSLYFYASNGVLPFDNKWKYVIKK